MSTFIESAESRETSPEIMEAIETLCTADVPHKFDRSAEAVWEEPTSGEFSAVIDKARQIQSRDKNYNEPLYWGAEGQVA